MKVLLVDDDEAILRSLARLLRRSHEVETAARSIDALICIRDNQPDVIICDSQLSGICGLQVQAEVSKVDPESARRFIFMSGNEDRRAATLGVAASVWLQKPFGRGVLLEAIERVGARHPESRWPHRRIA